MPLALPAVVPARFPGPPGSSEAPGAPRRRSVMPEIRPGAAAGLSRGGGRSRFIGEATPTFRDHGTPRATTDVAGSQAAALLWNVRATHDESTEQSSQPTHEIMPAMPIPLPVMRPVDPRQLKHCRRPQTVSAGHTFDTTDPLQKPTRKRRDVLQAQANHDDLWTQWRNLIQDGRRST